MRRRWWKYFRKSGFGKNLDLQVAMPATLFRGNFTPRFAMKTARKDMGLATELAHAVGVPMQMAEMCEAEMAEAIRAAGATETTRFSHTARRAGRCGSAIEGEGTWLMSRIATGIDHPIIAVRDMAAGRAAYERLGFTVTPRGRPPGMGHRQLVHHVREGLHRTARHSSIPTTRTTWSRILENREGLMGIAFGDETTPRRAAQSLRVVA